MMRMSVQTVDDAQNYAKSNNPRDPHFPRVTDTDRDPRKSFYVYKEKDKPTVIHIPLFNIENCEGMNGSQYLISFSFSLFSTFPHWFYWFHCLFLPNKLFSVLHPYVSLWFFIFDTDLFSHSWHTDEFGIKQDEDAYATFQTTYRDKDKIDHLANRAAKNVKINKDKILNEIREAAERRKRWRERTHL